MERPLQQLVFGPLNLMRWDTMWPEAVWQGLVKASNQLGIRIPWTQIKRDPILLKAWLANHKPETLSESLNRGLEWYDMPFRIQDPRNT